MAGIDNRIATMKFDNRDFERNAATTLSTLAKLKQSMNFGSIASGTIKGLGAIDSAISKIGLKTPFSPMIRAANAGLAGVGGVLDRLGLKNPFSSGVQGASEMQRAAQAAGGPQGMGALEGGITAVSNKFLALSTIAITTLSNITNRAVNAGLAWAKSFSVAPIMDGLHEYELNLKSIQTIQANTDRPLKEVENSLDQLNKYSDQTIYNFSEMARNVGTFTAAGVDLDTSVSSIKGIANLAALSGSSSEQAAGAMYQLSQAIAAGKVGLMDWNSVVNAGMGGKKLQNALAQTAVAMGKINAEQVKGVASGEQLKIAGQSFRESIMAQPGQESWLTSDILVNTLATMDGRFSEAALAAEKTASGLQKYTDKQIQAKIATARTNLEQKNGVKYTDEQFAALQKMSTAAFKSATEVKTLGQVFDIAKETIGSGWSASFRNIFGNLKEAKTLFTGMSNGLNDILNANSLARNELLVAWKEGGGRDYIIDGLKDAWTGFYEIIKAVGAGFRDIFPKKTSGDLISMSKAFADFMSNLLPGKETLADIRDIASGVFSVLGIGKQIIVGVFTGLKTLFGVVGAGNGTFLDFLAGLGRAITAFHDFLEQSGLITNFFTGLGGVLSVPVALLQGVASAFAAIFDGFNPSSADKAAGAIDGVSGSLSGMSKVAENIRDFFGSLTGMFRGLGEAIGKGLVGIGDLVASFLTSDSFAPAIDAINTGLFATLTAAIVGFLRGGPSIDVTGGVLSNIADSLEEATGVLTAMQTNLKADALMKIGISIAVLSGALLVLSTINPNDLSKALLAMSTGMGVLIGALVVLLKYAGPAGIVQIWSVSAALQRLSVVILLMAFSLKVMSNIEFVDMLRGLVGLAAMMAILNKAMVPMAAGSKGMIRASAAILLLGVAVNVLAVALKIFATMSWGEMIKGLAGLTGVLIALAVGLNRMPDISAEAVTLIALGVAINLLAVALKVFATMNWEEMAKGLLTLVGALGGIALAMSVMPKGMILQSVALVAVAGAMTVLAGALKIMGGMGWEEIGKGMVVLAGSMLILALGLNGIGPAGAIGAVGLLATAAAMTIFVPVMAALGAMSWESILKSLAALAGIFVILGVAGYALAPVSPIILLLGVALLALGAGLALAGAGALMAATAFGIVVAEGTAGAEVLRQVLMTVIEAIPPAMKAFAQGVVQFAVALGQGAPKIAQAFGGILNNILNQVIKAVPKFGKLILTLINTGLKVIVTAVPRIANAGLTFINGFLNAVGRNVPRIVDSVTLIITNFLRALGRNMPKIVDAGFDMIIDFMRGTAKAIRENSEEMGAAGADIGFAIVEGVVRGLSGAGDAIKDKLISLGRDAWEGVKNFFGIGSPSKLMKTTVGHGIIHGWVDGMHEEAGSVSDEIKSVGRTALDTLQHTMRDLDKAFVMDPNMSPTITPVLDLSQMAREANKVSGILAQAPIMPTMSYQAASDISTITQPRDPGDGPDAPGGSGGFGGDTYINYEHHLHSPTPLDSTKIYRDSRSLISMKREELSK